MKKKSTAIVLCAGSSGLGVVRSLHVAGIQSIAVCMNSKEEVLFSRLPEKKIIIDSVTHPDDALNTAIAPFRGQGFVLIPSTDAFVLFLNRHRESLSKGFYFTLPSKELCESLIFKQHETHLIREAGIPIPKTVQNIPEAAEELTKELALPIIIKPRSVEHRDVLGKKNIILSSADDLHAFYEKFKDDFHSLLAQEVIPGKDETLWVCHCTFDVNNDLVTFFSFRRLRLSPSHFGVTSYAVSEYNEQIITIARQIGKQLGYSGPAMMEFKYDARDNQYKYIEINPGRIGMCNIFDTTCGVNSIYATYLLAQNAETSVLKNLRQKNNIIYMSLVLDIRTRYKDGESIGTIFKHYVFHVKQKHVEAFFSWLDPLPFCADIFFRIKKYVKKIGNRN
jgi:predicted ATP-grasp superfamily ATP-dependent carboligase